MNKQESKYFYTASLFDQALIYLLNEKDIDYITVKEICKKAGFNRSTFYLHYESITDLVNETMDYIINLFQSKFNKDPNEIFKKLEDSSMEDLIFINDDYLKPYLEFIKENKNIYLAYLRNSGTLKTNDAVNDLNKYLLGPIMIKFGIPNEDIKYWSAYFLNGINAIISIWVKNDCEDDIEYIEKVIIDCIRPYGDKYE